MIDRGHGTPIVVIPGLPGPWRFIAPTVEALAKYYRVLTMSLGQECTIDSDVERVRQGLDEKHIDRAAICGISLGGLIALRFAARYPKRTTALVLVSTPGPGATLLPRHRLYVRWPRLFGVLFLIETPLRIRHDLRWSQLRMLFGRPVAFSTLARRGRLIEETDIAADCARVTSPTLVVTGERAFDRIVPVDSTLGYLKAIPGSGHVRINETGHLGAITRPEQFRAILQGYVDTLLEETA